MPAAFSGSASLVGAPTRTILNETLTDADTEYPVNLGEILSFTWQCRTAVNVRFAFTTGKVAAGVAPYGTIKANGGWDEPLPPLNRAAPVTVYLACSTPNVVVEIVTFS